MNTTNIQSEADACLEFQGKEAKGNLFDFPKAATFILVQRSYPASKIPKHSGKLASCKHEKCEKSAVSKKVLCRQACTSGLGKNHKVLLYSQLLETWGRTDLLKKAQRNVVKSGVGQSLSLQLNKPLFKLRLPKMFLDHVTTVPL